MNQKLLDRIVQTLHEDAWNYSVFLKVYQVQHAPPVDSLTIIRSALGTESGPEIVDSDIQAKEVWSDIESALLYEESDGAAGPSHSVLGSPALAEMLAELKEEVITLASRATMIERFELEKHPAYPVFWDFAFLFREEGEASLFIGSSSD